MGLGVVIRDHEGDLVSCFMRKSQEAMDSKHAEALALKWAVMDQGDRLSRWLL